MQFSFLFLALNGAFLIFSLYVLGGSCWGSLSSGISQGARLWIIVGIALSCRGSYVGVVALFVFRRPHLRRPRPRRPRPRRPRPST